MTKHRFCKVCDCNVGVTLIFNNSQEKKTVYECNNCLGEIVVNRRQSAKKKKVNELLTWLLEDNSK